jgi:Spy/CpxP family protein refolding chaperone
MTTRGRTRLKIWLVVVGVFALGCLSGVALDGAYRLRAAGRERAVEHNGHRGGQDIFERMRSDLSLTDEQARQVKTVLDETRDEFRTLSAECRPRYDAIRQKGRERIRALLTPEQQQRFDAKVAERDARERDRDKGNEH